jgi:hypothetical protein
LVGGPRFFLTSCLAPSPLPSSPNAARNGYPFVYSPSPSSLRVAGKEIRLNHTDYNVFESTDKKENEIFLIYCTKEIELGAVAKSYMRKGFLIYEEMQKYSTIYEEAVSHI